MFESAALGRSYSAEAFQSMAPDLRMSLFRAQQAGIANKLPVLIIIAGVDGSGRGAVANMRSEWMDAKGLRNHTFWMQTDEERGRPEAWRYWRKLPGAGEMGVFLGGWYGEAIRRYCCGDMKEGKFTRLMHRWDRLEHTLAASGMVIVKLWLHLSKKAHKERLKYRLAHKEIHHFTPYDEKSGGDYDGLTNAAAKAITLTDLLEEVPIDSARFLFNMHDAGSGIDFDLDQAVKTDNDNPVYYVQYAHARICSILKKMESEGVQFAGAEKVDATLLTEPSEMDLIRMLAAFPQEIVMAAEKYDPSRINRFVIDLASAFHRFYGSCRIQGADPAVQQARLALCIGVKNAIFNVLTMFKINVPEKM